MADKLGLLIDVEILANRVKELENAKHALTDDPAYKTALQSLFGMVAIAAIQKYAGSKHPDYHAAINHAEHIGISLYNKTLK